MAKRHVSPDYAQRVMEAASVIQEAAGRVRELTIAAAEEVPSAFDPREIRCDLDARAIEHTALVALLIENGTFTADEYLFELAKAMQLEAERLERASNGEGLDEDSGGRTERGASPDSDGMG